MRAWCDTCDDSTLHEGGYCVHCGAELRCPVCGKLIAEKPSPAIYASNWPYEGLLLCSRGCNEWRYELRKRVADCWEVMIERITSLGYTYDEARRCLRGYDLDLPEDLDQAVQLYRLATQPHIPVPIGEPERVWEKGDDSMNLWE